MRNNIYGILFVSLALLLLYYRSTHNSNIVSESYYPGGSNFTTMDTIVSPFGQHANGLTHAEQNSFIVGNSFFRNTWVSAPSSIKSLDGLGPLYNASSCSGCHNKDGRGRPQVFDENLNGLIFKMHIHAPRNKLEDDPIYGSQLQDKSINGAYPEAVIQTSYEKKVGYYKDGSRFELRIPKYRFSKNAYGQIYHGTHFSARIAQQLPGLGLLENIPERSIAELEDVLDRNRDGISGKISYQYNNETKKYEIGRFGWKASHSTLTSQISVAFVNDMGLTTSRNPNENLSETQRRILGNTLHGGMPEVSDQIFHKIVDYTRLLAVPVKRGIGDREILNGESIFQGLKCSSCHVPKMLTGKSSSITALNSQIIFPYTDLLLHDMGEGLSDPPGEGCEDAAEWRTPPLWGIGLIHKVNKVAFFLHDGRARNVEEAILWHDGEARTSKEAFMGLSKRERQLLINFVESL